MNLPPLKVPNALLQLDDTGSSLDPSFDGMPPDRGVMGPRRRTPKKALTSEQKLAQLGFDPIEEAVKLYKHVRKEILYMEGLRVVPDGMTIDPPKGCKTRQRYSSMAHGALLTLEQKLINDLMRYGYARVSESVTVETKDATPLCITMTQKGEVYEAPSMEDLMELDSEDEDG